MGHLTPGGDDNDQELSAGERHEIEPLERPHIRSDGESDLVRRTGDFLRHVGKKIFDRSRAPQARLHLWRRSHRLPFGEELVDIYAVTKVGWDPARRGVRLP